MHDWESLSHVRWDCKYHVVIVPKYRRRALYGKFRRDVGQILRDLLERGASARPCAHVSEGGPEVQPRSVSRYWCSERGKTWSEAL